MKTYLIVLAILSVSICVKGQSTEEFKKIMVQDARHKGLDFYDTTTTGHPFKEVYIERGLTTKKSRHVNLGCDTCNVYCIGFINLYNNKPVKYSISHIGNEEFVTALYRWTTDSTVAVTLYQENVLLSKEYTLGFRNERCILYSNDNK